MKNFFFSKKLVFYSMYLRIFNIFLFCFFTENNRLPTMESIFPQEIIHHIYELDPTKRYHFDKVYHQLRMRQVWYQIHSTATFRNLFHEAWPLNFGADNPTFHMTEEMFEYHVDEHCRYHRILGNKPRLPYDQYDFLAVILGV